VRPQDFIADTVPSGTVVGFVPGDSN